MTERQQQELDLLELQKKQLEVERLQLDKDKIQIEIKELKKGWARKQLWAQMLITLLIGAAGVYVAFSTNIIGLQEKKAEVQRLDSLMKLKSDSIKTSRLTISLQEDSIHKSREEKYQDSISDAKQIERLNIIEINAKERITLQQQAITKQNQSLIHLKYLSDSIKLRKTLDSTIDRLILELDVYIDILKRDINHWKDVGDTVQTKYTMERLVQLWKERQKTEKDFLRLREVFRKSYNDPKYDPPFIMEKGDKFTIGDTLKLFRRKK